MRSLLAVSACTIIAVFSFSCTSDSEFRDAVSRYKRGDGKSLNAVEQILVANTAKEKYDEKGLALNDSALFRYTDNEIEVLYPEEMSFSYEGKINDIIFFAADNTASYCDGKNIYYIDDGDSEIVFTSGDKEDIKSLLIVNGEIMYYLRSSLYKIDMNSKRSELLIKDIVTSPYKNYYNVIIKKLGDSIVFASGIAGSYHISVAEYPSMKIKMKNIQAASSKYSIIENDLYYIGGTTGNWEIYKLNLQSKNKKSLERMKNITEFAFTSNGYFYENADGLHISNYKEKSRVIPVHIQLIGSITGDCIIKYNNAIHIIDSVELMKYGFIMADLLNK
jgi:hypothetical protein